MYNYLSDKTADYTTATLSIASQVSLPQTGDKPQVVHELDDGVTVVGLSSSSYFIVQLQWPYISESDKNTIMSLWHSSSKADGRRRTFYWQHPTDGHTYTVRFMSQLIVDQRPATLGVSTITLRVEGNKPA